MSQRIRMPYLVGAVLLAGMLAGSLALAGEDPPPPEPADEPVVTLSVEDEPIRDVLARLAKLGKANLIVSSDVRGRMTIRLDHVPWQKALETVVAVTGYRIVEEDGGILRVGPETETSAPPTPVAKRVVETDEDGRFRITGVVVDDGGEAVEKARVATRTVTLFDVRDLVERVPDLLKRIRHVAGKAEVQKHGGNVVLVRGDTSQLAKIKEKLAHLRRLVAAGHTIPPLVEDVLVVTLDAPPRRLKLEKQVDEDGRTIYRTVLVDEKGDVVHSGGKAGAVRRDPRGGVGRLHVPSEEEWERASRAHRIALESRAQAREAIERARSARVVEAVNDASSQAALRARVHAEIAALTTEVRSLRAEIRELKEMLRDERSGR